MFSFAELLDWAGKVGSPYHCMTAGLNGSITFDGVWRVSFFR